MDLAWRRTVFEPRRLVLLGVLVAALAAGLCADAQPAQDSQAPNDQAPAATTNYDYVLGPGDILRITVFGEDNLSGQFTVAGNGALSFPLIGDVPAVGKTVGAVRDEIADALRAGYIKDPKVSAEVFTFRPYYILGEVNKPGQYPYSDGITVMNAIATAGGFTYRANHNYVFIKLSNEPAEHKVRLNDALQLSPGETIRVIERYF
jgi:protein involved in polysaccharide export with SLBB domain